MRLRIRVFLLMLVALVPAIAIQLYNEFDLRHRRESEVREAALEDAQLVAANMSAILEGSRQLLVALAELPAIQSLDRNRCAETLGMLLAAELPAYANIAVADMSGNFVCQGHQSFVGDLPVVSDRTYFRDAKQTGAFVVGEYAAGRSQSGEVLPVAQPIMRANEMVGVLVAGLDLGWLQQHFQRRPLQEGTVLTITDHGGTILVSLPAGQHWVGQEIPEAHRPYVLGDMDRTAELTDLDGLVRVFAYAPVNYPPLGFAVAIGVDKQRALAPINSATVRGLSLILGGLVIGLAAAWAFNRYFIDQPVNVLLETTRRWTAGDYGARVGVKSAKTELEELGYSFDTMAERLQQHLLQKDMMLREVNHRIMNSLQLLSSVLGLQRRRMADPEAVAQFDQARRRIQSMAVVHRRLSRHDAAEALDFRSFIQELITEIARSVGAGDVGGAIEVDIAPVRLRSDKLIPLALIVFELMTNALKYARVPRRGTMLRVSCVVSEDGTLKLQVTDSGPGLPDDFEQKKGLGMQLVGTLVRQLRGSMTTETSATGTNFTVTVPLGAAAGDDVSAGTQPGPAR
ncbi:MAG TPA: histidine kinase dimerization/phosphoacceptor domain -containing protein [Alphaproteobacteria bacterium]